MHCFTWSPQLCFARCVWCKRIQDSLGLWIPLLGFQLLDSRSFSGFLRFQLLVGFGISTAVFRIPQANLFKIPDSTCESLPHSGIPYMSRSVSNARARIRARLRNSRDLRCSNTLAYRFSSQRETAWRLDIKCFVIFLAFHFNSNKRITAVNQDSRLGTYKKTNLILKTTERMIYKVLYLYYLRLFPPLASVSLLG